MPNPNAVVSTVVRTTHRSTGQPPSCCAASAGYLSSCRTGAACAWILPILARPALHRSWTG